MEWYIGTISTQESFEHRGKKEQSLMIPELPRHHTALRNLTTFTAIVALANLGITIWHLQLAAELNPALSFAQAARIGAMTAVLTLLGVILLWAQHKLSGSFALVIVFGIGLVIGSLEHFIISGPNNVFDAGHGEVAFLFRLNVAILVILEIAGLWGAARVIGSDWRSRHHQHREA